MNELKVFENQVFGQVRTLLKDGEPWFVAADVCRVLEISNPTDALGRLDDDERARFNLGRQGEANIVNEPGLYSLVLGSRKPEAKAFKRWVTHEVLPAIRMYGGYVTPRGIEALLLAPEMVDKFVRAMRAQGKRFGPQYTPAPEEKRAELKQSFAQLIETDAVIRRTGDMVVLERAPVKEMLARHGFGWQTGLRALDEIYPLRRDGCGRRTTQIWTGEKPLRVVAAVLVEREVV